MKKIIASSLLVFITSCAQFDFHMRDITLPQSNNILIGFFERRNLKFDPYMIRNFRDTLGFNFFKYGYRSKLVTNEDNANTRNRYRNISQERIQKLCRHHGTNIFIQGAISEREIGDFVDKEISSLVTFLIYNANGEKIGEAHYSTSDTLSDVDTMKDVADTFTSRLHSVISSQ